MSTGISSPIHHDFITDRSLAAVAKAVVLVHSMALFHPLPLPSLPLLLSTGRSAEYL